MSAHWLNWMPEGGSNSHCRDWVPDASHLRSSWSPIQRSLKKSSSSDALSVIWLETVIVSHGTSIDAALLSLVPAVRTCSSREPLPDPCVETLCLLCGGATMLGLFGPMLDGLLDGLAIGPLLAFGGRGGSARLDGSTATVAGRTNMPCAGAHSKYRSPCTIPSFFPVGASSSTPTHDPRAKCVSPTYRTMACRPSWSLTVWPRVSSGGSAMAHVDDSNGHEVGT